MRALLALALIATAAAEKSVNVPTTGWTAQASDGVTATAAQRENILHLDWDFHRVSGYAFVRRPAALTLADNYAITMRVRWTGGVNDFQLKLVDASGENVWWVNRPDIALKPGWQTLTFRKRDVEFAWGPSKAALRKTGSIEMVVVRGRDGGKGSLDVADLAITELPAVAPTLPAPTASAPDGDPSHLFDGTAAPWRGKGPLTIDFGGTREFGGIVLRWIAAPAAYDVATSVDGTVWDRRRRVTASDGGDDPIALPETEPRYLRIVPGSQAALASLSVMPLAWAATPNAFVASLAAQAPRGTYPRGFSDEQSYWTLVGTDGGEDSGLIGEDGTVELGKGGPSIEPFVVTGGKRYGWAETRATQALADGYLPMPSVTRTGPDWTLETRTFADPGVSGGRMMMRYTLTNTRGAPLAADLLLAVRPFQVNPPAQFLSQRGGVSAITGLRWDGTALAVSGARAVTVQPVRAPGRVVLASFDEGGAIAKINGSPATAGAQSRAARGWAPASAGEQMTDETGLASATLIYPVKLAPNASTIILLAAPFTTAPAPTPAQFVAAEARTAAGWRAKLDRVVITVPPVKQALADTVRTALAHILMSRDGPMLRPGTRSYARSWIRDGAMISEGLLRLGLPEIVAAYADWYTPYQFASGKIPCCVDFKGADPVPENDSQGEYIFLATQLYRYTGDKSGLARHWPAMLAAERYMETLRATTRRDPAWTRGLMPPSISHEGYSAKAQNSLWDDFWALRGYKDAAFAAKALGKPEHAAIARHRDAFQADIHAAIAAAAEHWNIPFIPGATSLGDFDATSTTVGLDPGGEQARLDPALLAGTFDRYWRDFLARRDGDKAWADYTPYEIRNVSAAIRLGHRERVDPMLDFFFADRRPGAWNGWAEVVGKDPRAVRFIGDMPHAWIASDFIRAALDMFAYERAEDGALVLGAGLSDAYLTGNGSAIKGLRTPHGILDLAIRTTPARLTVTIGGTARPPGGFVLPWPWTTPPGSALADGRTVRFADGAFVIPATGKPITLEVSR